MTNSISPAAAPGLGNLAGQYRAVLCDVWGVLHNGVRAFEPARDALARYREEGGIVVLVTNAPRPNPLIIAQLAALGIGPECFDEVVTSGDVTRELLAEQAGSRALHIGPERDHSLYEGLDIELADEDDAEIISCTGLFDDERESPDDYDARFARWAERDLLMVCANPDIVAERGDRLIWCAGALAERYAAMGGRTAIAGKPHRPIYDAALAAVARINGGPVAKSTVMAIGDGAPTDLRGAIAEDLDVLFISGGIHAATFGPPRAPDPAAIHRFLSDEGLGARAYMPALAW